MLLVNDLLKFQMAIIQIHCYFLLKKCENPLQCITKDSHIFSTKNNSVFSSPVRKYRKSYCSHPGVGIRVAQMLKFFIKVFVSLYLLTMLMDQVDTLHVGRHWSEVLCSTIMTHPG